MHKKMYGLSEVADMLGESKQVIRYRLKEKQFVEPQYRISASPIWTYEQLEEEFKKHKNHYWSRSNGYYDKLLATLNE